MKIVEQYPVHNIYSVCNFWIEQEIFLALENILYYLRVFKRERRGTSKFDKSWLNAKQNPPKKKDYIGILISIK